MVVRLEGVSISQKGCHGWWVLLCFCYVNPCRKQYQDNFLPEGCIHSELVPSPTCSLDTFLSLAFDEEPTTPSPTCSPNVFFGIGFSPSCSLNVFFAPPDNSYLSLEDSDCLPEGGKNYNSV